jgi:hypothetical protein
LLAIAVPSRRRAAWPRRCADGRGRVGRSRAGDDVFLADDFSERDEAIGYQFRVLDEIGGVPDNQKRTPDLFSFPFIFVPDLRVFRL